MAHCRLYTCNELTLDFSERTHEYTLNKNGFDIGRRYKTPRQVLSLTYQIQKAVQEDRNFKGIRFTSTSLADKTFFNQIFAEFTTNYTPFNEKKAMQLHERKKTVRNDTLEPLLSSI